MNNEHTSFELITSAGNSKSYSMLAIEAAREKEFHKANEYIKNDLCFFDKMYLRGEVV